MLIFRKGLWNHATYSKKLLDLADFQDRENEEALTFYLKSLQGSKAEGERSHPEPTEIGRKLPDNSGVLRWGRKK